MRVGPVLVLLQVREAVPVGIVAGIIRQRVEGVVDLPAVADGLRLDLRMLVSAELANLGDPVRFSQGLDTDVGSGRACVLGLDFAGRLVLGGGG